MTVIAETDRLRLRVWTLSEADLDAAERIYGDPDVMRWIEDGRTYDRDGVRAGTEKGLAVWTGHGVQHWAVEVKDGPDAGTVIGACGFHPDEGGPGLEMVYHFAKAWWGQGYATEAAQAAFAYVTAELQPPHIVAATRKENAASATILQRLGFADLGPMFFADSGVDERVWKWTPRPTPRG